MAEANFPEEPKKRDLDKEYMDYYAEEVIKHFLFYSFGIHYDKTCMEQNTETFNFHEFISTFAMVNQAVSRASLKYYKSIIQPEMYRIFRTVQHSKDPDRIYLCLKEAARRIELPQEYIFYMVMSIVGCYCVLISDYDDKYESFLYEGVAGGTKYIIEEGLLKPDDILKNASNFLKFMYNE